AALERIAFGGVEPRQVRAAVGRQEEAASRPEHAPQFVPPGELELLRQVREDRERVDEVEALVRERDGRRERIRLEASEGEVGAAPLDGCLAHVAAADRS